MSGIRITGQWSHEEIARLLDHELGNAIFWQCVALVGFMMVLQTILEAAKLPLTWARSLPIVALGVLGMAAGWVGIILALDRRTGIVWPKAYPLRRHLLGQWAIFIAVTTVGILRANPLFPLLGIALLVACRFLLPRPWWRGVNRRVQSTSIPVTK